ncbi:MAG: hypothetical protein R2759_07675 [Bacteroidales bacterium]
MTDNPLYNEITHYTLWRELAASKSTWTYLGAVTADYSSEYFFTAPTLADSTVPVFRGFHKVTADQRSRHLLYLSTRIRVIRWITCRRKPRQVFTVFITTIKSVFTGILLQKILIILTFTSGTFHIKPNDCF